MNHHLADQIKGIIFGQAIGDALGFGMGMGRTFYTVVNHPGFLENPSATAQKVWQDSGQMFNALISSLKNKNSCNFLSTHY